MGKFVQGSLCVLHYFRVVAGENHDAIYILSVFQRTPAHNEIVYAEWYLFRIKFQITFKFVDRIIWLFAFDSYFWYRFKSWGISRGTFHLEIRLPIEPLRFNIATSFRILRLNNYHISWYLLVPQDLQYSANPHVLPHKPYLFATSRNHSRSIRFILPLITLMPLIVLKDVLDHRNRYDCY